MKEARKFFFFLINAWQVKKKRREINNELCFLILSINLRIFNNCKNCLLYSTPRILPACY